MKYIVLVGDGMAGWPLKEIGGKTCLQVANTPQMDKIASAGEVGILRTIPKGFAPGSDIANLSIVGYDPSKYYTGRAPLEAASMGIKLGPDDVAYRCNLVTLRYLKNGHKAIIEDYSGGHISTDEARRLIEEINNKLGDDKIIFYSGMSYRHLMIWKNGKDKVECTPPHDITGKEISDYLPVGQGEDVLRELIMTSVNILQTHPVNKERVKKGLNPANSIWLWGQGKKPNIPKFSDKYGVKGALISAVDLTKGLGVCAGFDIINVKGATGYLDTNYLGKAEAALNALRSVDFVYLHVEAPDEAGHSGDTKSKIKAIGDFDSKVVGPVLKGMKAFKDYKILLLPDHATPIEIRTHTDEPVPFAIYRKENSNTVALIQNSDKSQSMGIRVKSFTEEICKIEGIRVFEKGYKLMDYFIKG